METDIRFHSIEYFGDRAVLSITVPGLPQETMTSYLHDLHAMRFAQGFAWPALDNGLKSETTGFGLAHQGRIEPVQPDGGMQLAGAKCGC